MKSLLGFAFVVVIVIHAQPALADWPSESRRAEECTIAVDRDTRLQSLNVRLARRDPTLQQLADEGLASEADARSVALRQDLELPCRNIVLSALREFHPHLVSAYQLRYLQSDMVYVKLLQRRITFGNANRLLQESWIELARRQEQYNRARNEEERRAIADSLNQISQQARTPPPPYPSSGRLTCRWVGPTLYCDAY